jgi:hypothetical protein
MKIAPTLLDERPRQEMRAGETKRIHPARITSFAKIASPIKSLHQ